MSIPTYMQENILKQYQREADKNSDKKAQNRLESQTQSAAFSKSVCDERAKWISFSIDRVQGFDQLTAKEAESILNAKLIPACESNEAGLSNQFNVKKVQNAFALFQKTLEGNTTFTPLNLISKNGVENNSIAALLLHGFQARFKKDPMEWEFMASKVNQ